MQPLDELRVEYKRLERHVNYLAYRYSPAVARDLAASLRNWVQLAGTIDETSELNNWNLGFMKDTLTKAAKAARAKGDSYSIPLAGSVRTKNMQIAGVEFYNRKLSQEEVKKLYDASRSSRPTITTMKFSDWLGNSAYQVSIDGSKKDISRRIFIDRSANLLGGTHPITNFVETEHATWADPYIVDSLNTTVGIWPIPYAILMESAQEILRAFKPYLSR